jgi:hypothetical protein
MCYSNGSAGNMLLWLSAMTISQTEYGKLRQTNAKLGCLRIVVSENVSIVP